MEMKIPDIPEHVEPGCVRDYATVKRELESLSTSHPKVVKLESIGRSAEGREILLVVVGNGERKVMVQCRIHGAEVTSTEAMMDYLPELVNDQANRDLLSKVTLLAIPMAHPDAADLYATTRHLLRGRLPEELLRLWQERTARFPDYYQNLLDTFWGRNIIYGNRFTPYLFRFVSEYRDPATGLTKYVSNFEEWLWTDALETKPADLTGLYSPNRDNWQLVLPETRAFFQATVRFKPDCFLDLHTYAGYTARPGKVPGTPAPIAVRDGHLVYQLYAFPISNPVNYYRDPDAAWKGVFMGERFAHPRYLKLSGLDIARKADKRYQFPSTTEDQVAESLKVAKIMSQAAENASGQRSAPIGYWHWNGYEQPMRSSVAVACNPEFRAASVACEVFGGHECGSLGLEYSKPAYKAAVDAVLRYYAGLGLPDGWDSFPVFQGPSEVISKRTWILRRIDWDTKNGIAGWKDRIEG